MLSALLLSGAIGAVPTPVYDDALAPGWESWSWNGQYDFASPRLADGAAAIDCVAGGWGALSLRAPAPFGPRHGQNGLRFQFAGPGDGVWFILEADGDGARSDQVLIGSFTPVDDAALTEIIVDLTAFGDHDWTRIDFMDATGNGAAFVVDALDLLSGDLGPLGYTAAEAVGPARLMLLGSGDPEVVRVTLDGAPVGIRSATPADAPARLYLDLAAELTPGRLEVCDAARCFTQPLVAHQAALGAAPTHEISPLIYGVAVPGDLPGAVAETGATVVRWGGNAVSLYDPIGRATNAGIDWFFENRDGGDAVAWMDAVRATGARPAFTLPALDWVAADTTGCGFPEDLFGPQQRVDPYGRDCGNGLDPEGNPIAPGDPGRYARPWDVEQAAAWMDTVPVPPDITFVGNEIDIAGSTHRDVHPAPTTYEEQRDRFLAFGTAVKTAWPETTLAGPSSCCWWYYWNSAAGQPDKDAHGGEDFLPWFLAEVAAADARDGLRRLDVLDVHYYPDGVFNDATDEATRARRLRSTRSLWDPTYRDEGWIGADQWATERQPDRNTVMLLPRLRALLDRAYPGTGLGVTEWNFGAERDLSGGLAVADVLGIFGREGLDLATYWTSPPAASPAAAAFGLYAAFGTHSVPVDGFDPDRLGVFAARTDDGALTVIIVNKDPAAAVRLALPGLSGRARVERFGGALRGARVVEPDVVIDGAVVVPAYSAARLHFAADDEPPPGPEADLGDAPSPVADAAAPPPEADLGDVVPPTPDAAAPGPEVDQGSVVPPTPDAAAPPPEVDQGSAPPPTPDAAAPPPEVDQGSVPRPVADAAASAERDAGPEAEADAGPTKRGGSGSGCSQVVGRAPQAPWALLLAAVLGVLVRTRAMRLKRATTDRAAR
jgi:hypothetical protein